MTDATVEPAGKDHPLSSRPVTIHGFTVDNLPCGLDTVKDNEQILFAGWMSSLGQLANGTLHLDGLPSPGEVCLLQTVGQQPMKKYFGYETWAGYQTINGSIMALKSPASSSLHQNVVCLLDKAKDVACSGVAGQHTIVAIDAERRLLSWCCASTNEIGERVQEISATPQPVPVLDDQVGFVKVWAGEAHFLALSEDGRLFSWGSGRYGQLGHGTLQNNLIHPTPIEALEGLRIVDAACGATHSLALSDIGDVYSFGLNNHGQLGIGGSGGVLLPFEPVNTALPQLVDFYQSPDEPIQANIVQIACGNSHSAALDDRGHLYTCGWNKYRQLGRVAHGCLENDAGQMHQASSESAMVQSSSTFFLRASSDRTWKHLRCGRWTTYVW